MEYLNWIGICSDLNENSISVYILSKFDFNYRWNVIELNFINEIWLFVIAFRYKTANKSNFDVE